MRHLLIKTFSGLSYLGLAAILSSCAGESGGGLDVSQLCSALDTANKTVTVPSSTTFFDDFEYTVDRSSTPVDPSGINNPFVTTGGWSFVKAVNISGSYNGFLYTTSSIPGYPCTSFPGRNSSKALAIEALPASMGGQTDFYLQYANGSTTDAVPGDVWFQFWIYPNHYGNQQSHFARNNKFIYPCRGNSYPCTDLNWLSKIGRATGEPYWNLEEITEPYMIVDGTGADYQAAAPENVYKLGQTDISEYLLPNRWTLVKLHFDTSSQSGSYEAWYKPIGGNWIKVADWRDGVTANFSWQIDPANQGGHRMFRIPTTIGEEDSWIYLDDFVMAVSESDLPVYQY